MLFLAYTGVRFGEMAALRVGRLDLRRSRAVIAESVTPVQGQGLVWGTPKTHQRREVPIPRFLAAELGDHIQGRQPDDLVFAGIRNGQPLRVSTFRTAFSAAARDDRGARPHPHQLRHTAASLAIAAGADVKVVQQMLGHASATMTLDTYGHLFEDRLDEVGDAMDAAPVAPPSSASQRPTLCCPVLPQCCPGPISDRNDEDGPDQRFRWSGPLFGLRTPDRIRTGATALRGRRARPLHNGGKHCLEQPAELYLGAPQTQPIAGQLGRRSRWDTRTRT